VTGTQANKELKSNIRKKPAPDLRLPPRLPMGANLSRVFFVKTPTNRHPERSASQIYRVIQRLWRGVEGPRRCYLTDAVRSFSPTEPHRAGPPRSFPGAENQELARR
jgi:hypothetical protein